MITELTKEQEANLEVYKEKWLKIGLDTSPIEPNKLWADIKAHYVSVGLKEPLYMIVTRSPMECLKVSIFFKFLTANLSKKNGDITKYEEVVSEFIPFVNQMIQQEKKNENQIKLAAMASIKEFNELKNNRSKYVETLKKESEGFCYGHNDAHWLSFYNFFEEQCDLECCKKLDYLMEIAKNCGWWIPEETFVFVSEKPREINLVNGRLHKDGGPAIIFEDGFGIWSLNGIRVSKEIAETPADKLDPHLIITEANADVRAQIALKIGSERICKELNARVVDTFIVGKELLASGANKYELLMLDIRKEQPRPFLKMINESAGTVHYEGVPPHCKTAKEAFLERYPVFKDPKYKLVGMS